MMTFELSHFGNKLFIYNLTGFLGKERVSVKEEMFSSISSRLFKFMTLTH